jgi:hypothetical protein
MAAPAVFFNSQAPGIPLTHRPNGQDAVNPIAEPAVGDGQVGLGLSLDSFPQAVEP